MHRLSTFVLGFSLLAFAPLAKAQETIRPFSQCLAVAQTLPGATYANLTPAELDFQVCLLYTSPSPRD